MSRFNIFRDGYVHVMADRCPTCIFRAGNLMGLNRGTVAAMVDECLRRDTAIVCHDSSRTEKNAVCRGFFDLYSTEVTPLKAAVHLGAIKEQWADDKE